MHSLKLGNRACRLGAVIVAAALFAVLAPKASAASRHFVLPACPDPSSAGALHVSGNEVLTSTGQRFTFYGFSTYGGLQNPIDSKLWPHAVASSRAQIEAAPHWSANTIRIQVGEANLFTHRAPGDPVNVAFLNDLCSQVQLARREGLQVVLNDNTLFSNYYEQNPTARTATFWKYIGAIYGNQPGVMFDLFNEPRAARVQMGPGQGPRNLAWIWNTWLNGGSGLGYTYVGEQQLVNLIRYHHWNNIIWVEGPLFDDALGQYQSYPIAANNLVLSIHHPDLSLGLPNWYHTWGYLARQYPLVDGEWSQYAGIKDECYDNATTAANDLLTYLASIHAGLIAWSLQAGALTVDPNHYVPTNLTVARDTTNPTDLYKPNAFAANFACNSAHYGQGAGQLVYNYFRQYSTQSNAGAR